MKLTYSVFIAALFMSSIHGMEFEKQREHTKVPRVKCMQTYARKMTLYNTTLALLEHNEKLNSERKKDPIQFTNTFFVQK